MEAAPVTAATGALGPVIAKLAALLGREYKLRRRTRRDINFIRSKLKPVHSVLWNIWEREELDVASKALKMEALDLADDMDDAIVDFIHSLERNLSNNLFVQTKIKGSIFQDFKKRASDVSGRCCSKWKEKKPTDDSSPGKIRAYPFIRTDASELVGMIEQRDRLIRHLIREDGRTALELQLKTELIFGTAGMGKTTLANLVFEAIGSMFQSRAFVSVNPGGSTREILARILEQVAANSSVPLAGTEAATKEHLIDIISNFLMDKRYLVIIDDIWNLRELEIVMQSLPKNNLGSRIVITTRTKSVSEKWRYDPNALIHKMFPTCHGSKGWVYEISENNIVNLMIAMNADLVTEGFDIEHPIVKMCGGTPLAVRCMLSAVAEERKKQAHQGKRAKEGDVQDEVLEQIMVNGIQNTPGFERLVESLQLSYDDLPHHMLKACLLYCSIYPDGHFLEKDNLVRLWVSEGFVCKEEEANGYFQELVNRGLILSGSMFKGMHPMMRNFLRWKSRQDNFVTCSSEITPSYNNGCRIRRLFIYNSPCRDNVENQADPLFGLDWSHVRSLVVYEGMERVPFEKLEGVRVLDLCGATDLLGHHLKDICGLVRLRHLLGFNGDRICETPPEILRLRCLETFEVKGKKFKELRSFIRNLQQLKTLEVRSEAIIELPREIGALQQLQNLRMSNTCITELPREIGNLQQLKNLDMSNTRIRELPKELRSLQQLESLDISNSRIMELPKEIASLQQLKTLDITRTQITKLPKEIWKLQHLEHLIMSDTNVEIEGLNDLRSLQICDNASSSIEFPESIHQALKNSDLLSELAGEMLSFKVPGGLVVGAKQMHVPLWIKNPFNNLKLLDIRICKLEEQGIKILREMPQLHSLALRFHVVPREQVVISSEGFTMLKSLTVDSRVPRVTFQTGAMPMLGYLTFKFRFYAGPPNKDPVGINHLRRLSWIEFECNEDWYGGGDSSCIRPTIDVMRKEAQKFPAGTVYFKVCGRMEEINSPGGRDQQREMYQESSIGTGETNVEEESGVGEIEEDIVD